MTNTITDALRTIVALPVARILARRGGGGCCGRFTAMAAAVLCAPQAMGQTVGWWRFDEAPAGSVATVPASVIDVAAGNNGTPFGSPVYAAALDGCATGGLVFNGGSARIAVPDSAAYASLRSITVEAVLVTSGYSPSAFGLNQIVFRGDDRGGLDPFFLAIGADGRVGFFINNVLLVQSASPLRVGTLTHIGATLDDASGAAKLFVDRSLVASATTQQRPDATALTGTNPGLGIGNLQSGNFQQSFAGTIYEVRLSSAALSTEAMLPVRPSIASGPLPVTACPSDTAAFSVVAGGSGGLIYRWQWQSASAPGIWTDIIEGLNSEPDGGGGGGVIRFMATGAATAAVALTQSSTPQGSLGAVRAVRCIVSNACGELASNAAALAIGSCGCSLADVAGGGANGLSADGVVDGADFIAFINSFSNGDVAGDPLADVAGGGPSGLDADGVIDGSDFVAFVNAFAAGC